jgi:secreted Zn-dependent insulinase-like peptidase
LENATLIYNVSAHRVSCDTRWTFGIMGISFRVITTSKSAEEVSSRIEMFLLDFRKELVEMSKETYMENVVGLAKDKLEKFNSLEEEANNLWYEITESRYDWEIQRNETHALKFITKQQVIQAFDKWLCPTKSSRRKLEVHAIGTKDGVSSLNRPSIDTDNVGFEIDRRIKAFHKTTGNKTWGKV